MEPPLEPNAFVWGDGPESHLQAAFAGLDHVFDMFLDIHLGVRSQEYLRMRVNAGKFLAPTRLDGGNFTAFVVPSTATMRQVLSLLHVAWMIEL